MSKKLDTSNHIGLLAEVPYSALIDDLYAHQEKQGFKDIKPAHGVVFNHIGDGARITDMAMAANTSKQNMKYLVEYLEERGYVKKNVDRRDGRAYLFTLTAKGKRYQTSAAEVIEKTENRWAKKIGKDKMKKLKKLLAELGNEIMAG